MQSSLRGQRCTVKAGQRQSGKREGTGLEKERGTDIKLILVKEKGAGREEKRETETGVQGSGTRRRRDLDEEEIRFRGGKGKKDRREERTEKVQPREIKRSRCDVNTAVYFGAGESRCYARGNRRCMAVFISFLSRLCCTVGDITSHQTSLVFYVAVGKHGETDAIPARSWPQETQRCIESEGRNRR